MELTEVRAVLTDLAAAGCSFWVGGGWGVDALVGRQTREHRDLDLGVDADDEAIALRTLEGRGYRIETDWRPVRVELAAAGRGWVDLHPVRFDAAGHGRQAGVDGGHFDYPPDAFDHGMLDEVRVPCLSRDQQIRFHTGYPPRPIDLHDLALLKQIAAPVLLRNATPADLDALLAVQRAGAVRALSDIFPQDVHPFPREDLRARWTEEIADPDIDVYVAVTPEGRVVGFAAVRAMELRHFGTAVETWGSGVAQDLHDQLLVRMTPRSEGDRPRLWVFEANVRARRFYGRLGWRPTGEQTRSTFPPHPVLLAYERP